MSDVKRLLELAGVPKTEKNRTLFEAPSMIDALQTPQDVYNYLSSILEETRKRTMSPYPKFEMYNGEPTLFFEPGDMTSSTVHDMLFDVESQLRRKGWGCGWSNTRAEKLNDRVSFKSVKVTQPEVR